MALRRVLSVILIVFGFTSAVFAVTPVTVTGTITDFGGNVAQFGTVSFTLQPQNQAIFWRVANTNVLALPVTCGISGSGQLQNQSLTGPCMVWGNDVISPNGSAYIVNEFPNNQQGPIFKNAQILGVGPVDLSNITFLPNVNVMPDLSTFTLSPLQTSLIPGQTNLYSLGSSGDYFASGYISNLFTNTVSGVTSLNNWQFPLLTGDAGVNINTACTNLLATGGIIYLPSGTGVVSTAITCAGVNNIIISGAGEDATLLTNVGGSLGAHSIFNINSNQNITLLNMTVRNGTVNSAALYTSGQDGIYLTNTVNATVDNVKLTNVQGECEICLRGNKNVHITHSQGLNGQYTGISILPDNDGVYIQNDLIDGLAYYTAGATQHNYGIASGGDATTGSNFSKNVWIEDNKIRNNQNWEGIDTHGGENFHIQRNTVENVAICSVIQLAGTAGATFVNNPVSKNIHYVDNTCIQGVFTITNASNASPIVITTLVPHNFVTGQTGVVVANVGGNTAANGTWTVTVTGEKTFSLNGSTGNFSYTSGGTAAASNPVTGNTPNLGMPGIDVEGNNNGSGTMGFGPVQDLEMRGNKFVGFGGVAGAANSTNWSVINFEGNVNGAVISDNKCYGFQQGCINFAILNQNIRVDHNRCIDHGGLTDFNTVNSACYQFLSVNNTNVVFDSNSIEATTLASVPKNMYYAANGQNYHNVQVFRNIIKVNPQNAIYAGNSGWPVEKATIPTSNMFLKYGDKVFNQSDQEAWVVSSPKQGLASTDTTVVFTGNCDGSTNIVTNLAPQGGIDWRYIPDGAAVILTGCGPASADLNAMIVQNQQTQFVLDTNTSTAQVATNMKYQPLQFSAVVPYLTIGSGADICANILAQSSLLPSIGGTLDATGQPGVQNCGTNIALGGSNKPVKLKVPEAAQWSGVGLITLAGSGSGIECGSNNPMFGFDQGGLVPHWTYTGSNNNNFLTVNAGIRGWYVRGCRFRGTNASGTGNGLFASGTVSGSNSITSGVIEDSSFDEFSQDGIHLKGSVYNNHWFRASSTRNLRSGMFAESDGTSGDTISQSECYGCVFDGNQVQEHFEIFGTGTMEWSQYGGTVADTLAGSATGNGVEIIGINDGGSHIGTGFLLFDKIHCESIGGSTDHGSAPDTTNSCMFINMQNGYVSITHSSFTANGLHNYNAIVLGSNATCAQPMLGPSNTYSSWPVSFDPTTPAAGCGQTTVYDNVLSNPASGYKQGNNPIFFMGGQNAPEIRAFCTGTAGAAETDFLVNGACSGATSNTAQQAMATVGTLKNFTVTMLTAVKGAASAVTATVFKSTAGGAPSATSITCNVASGAKTCTDTTHFVTVAAGDSISFQFGPTNAGETAANVSMSVQKF